MDCRAATAHVGIVHDIVVKQREIMEHLDSYRLMDGCHRFFTHRLACGEREHRAQTFAPAIKGISDWVVKARRFRRKS